MHTIQTESPRRKGIPATTVVLALLCVMYALNYMVRVNVSTAAGAFKDQLHLSNTDLGWIFSAFAYPYLAVQILSGWISDRVGARVALTVFAVIWSAATIFMGLANSMAAMIFGRVMLGIGVSALPTATRAMSAWMPAREARLRARNHAFGGAAGECPHASARGGINRHRGVARIVRSSRNREPGLGHCVGLVLSRRSRRASLDEGNARASTHRSQSEMDVFAKARASRERAKEPVPFVRLARRMALVTVVYFCYGWTLWFFLAWVPQFFLHNYRMNLNHSAFFSGGVFLGGVLGDFSGGVVSDRIFEKTGDRKKARRNLIIFGFLCSLVMMLPIVLVHNLTSAAIFLSLAFFFAEFTVAPIWAIPMDIAPNFSGFASGFMNSGSALAAIISPVVAGKIIDATGNWELPFYGSIGLLLLGAILAVWMKTEEMPSEPAANAEPAVQPAV